MGKITGFLEIARWLGVALGIFFAFLWGNNPVEQFNILTVFTITFLAGLTGIESLFFGKKASESTGYQGGRGYQRQSAANNLALGVSALLAYFMAWGLYASAALMSVLLIFFSLSAINHTYSAVKEGNKNFKSYLRPILTILLLVLVLPFMIQALNSV
jgi:hypothetical protein